MTFTIRHGAAAALMAGVAVSPSAAQPNGTDWIKLHAGGRYADLTASREQSPRAGRTVDLGVAGSSNEHWGHGGPGPRGTRSSLAAGFHAAITVGDLITLPTVPTVDTRVVRWLNDRWGIAGRLLVGIGSNRPDEHAVVERRRPTTSRSQHVSGLRAPGRRRCTSASAAARCGFAKPCGPGTASRQRSTAGGRTFLRLPP